MTDFNRLKITKTERKQIKYTILPILVFMLIVGLAMGIMERGEVEPEVIDKPLSVLVIIPADSPRPSPVGEGTDRGVTTRGVSVSWYGEGRGECQGCSSEMRMANGEIFDETKMIASCSSKYQLGTLVTLRKDGMSITVKCTDRGGFEKLGREFDISKGAFEKLAPLSNGVIRVEVGHVVRPQL